MNMPTAAAAEARALRSSRQNTAELLERYPEISKKEVKQILHFLRNGRHLDVGLLTADERLSHKLDAFMSVHGKELRVGFTETAAVIGGIVAFLTVCWLVWEAVGPAL